MEKEKNSDGIGYMKRLRRPIGQIDVVLDTDAYNEIDDLYALAYMIRSSDRLNVKGIMAAPFYSPASMGRTRQQCKRRNGTELFGNPGTAFCNGRNRVKGSCF